MSSILKSVAKKQTAIDNASAANLWSMLKDRYQSISYVEFISKFIHDPDFSALTEVYLRGLRKDAGELEGLADRFSVKMPKRPPSTMRIPQVVPSEYDQMIFHSLYESLIAQTYALSRAAISATANDEVRQIFFKLFARHLGYIIDYHKYGKLKGWSYVEPAYISDRSVKREPLSLVESNNLWNHINERYDHLQSTRVFLNFVHDPDFHLLLKKGEKELQNQIKELEQLALKYDVPLPQRPPVKEISVVDPELFEDEFIYRQIFSGIQVAVTFHFKAVLECSKNDSLRDFFVQLLNKEMRMYSNYLKYGKTKGWGKIPPMYVNKV